jgi:hypothetical protein
LTAAELEARRALRKPGDTDAVTYAWASPDAELCGLARLASGAGADGSESFSALAIAFAGRLTVGVIAESGAVAPPELVAETVAPLERWTLKGSGELTFDLAFEALTPEVGYSGRQAVVKAGGMEGYEQLCRVTGTIGDTVLEGVGQRGHLWGNQDWDKIALTRAAGVWFEDGTGVALSAVRSIKTDNHADEAKWGASFGGERTGEINEIRLSTTYDGQERQLRAGLELYLAKDDDYPLRGVGEVATGSTLELGALRLDVAFFRWHVEGRPAVGRYDILRRP